MHVASLETTALRAVELGVQGRVDPRLLVATKRRLPGPKKAARLLAGLANAADDRQHILLVGMRKNEISGIEGPPPERWWRRLDDAFPGVAPDYSWTMVDVGGTALLAIATSPTDRLIAAYKGDDVIVPFFDGRRVVPAQLSAGADKDRGVDALPPARIDRGWVEHVIVRDRPRIEAFRGVLDVELQPTPGVMADKSCSATLLMPDRDAPVALDVQVHPAGDQAGVFRRDHGVEVITDFGVRVYLAAARTTTEPTPTAAAAQLVVSLLLPGRAVPELRSLFLSPDPSSEGVRWIV